MSAARTEKEDFAVPRLLQKQHAILTIVAGSPLFRQQEPARGTEMTTDPSPRVRPTRLTATLSVVAIGFIFAISAPAQLRQEKAEVGLLADRTAYEPGETVRVAAKVTVEEGWHVNSNTPTFDYLIPTQLDLELPAGWPEETVRYPKHKMQTFAFADQPLAVYDGEFSILAEVKVPAGAQKGPVEVRGTLRYQACNESQCLPPVTTDATVTLTVGPGGTPVASDLFMGTAAPSAPSEDAPGRGLAVMLLLALLGGLILNAMPCVLP